MNAEVMFDPGNRRRCFCLADLPASSPGGALPPAAEGDDEFDMVATASSLLPASLDTVIVLVAGICEISGGRATLCGGTEGRSFEQLSGTGARQVR
jgi:hypothetical protein